MKKMPNSEINMIAKNRYTKFIINEGLTNGKKIALEIYRLFKAEALRRKKLEPKIKKTKKTKKTKVKVKIKTKTKTGPPVVGRPQER